LGRLHCAVEKRYRDHVWQRVIRLLLGSDLLLVAFLAATDDVVGHLEGGNPHLADLVGHELRPAGDVQGSIDRGLGMDLCVVLLQTGASYRLEVLGCPVDDERPGNGVLESLVAFEDLARAGDAHAGQQCRVHAFLGDLRIRQTLPVRELPGPGHAQRVVRGAGDRDRVGRLRLIQPQRAGGPRGHRVRALGGVVESLGSDGCHVGETSVDLIGAGQRGKEIPAATTHALRRSQHSPKIVRRMVGLTGRKVAVHEVQVPTQRHVVERRSVRRRPPTSDQRGGAAAAKGLGERPHRPHRGSIERTDCDAERVENPDLELLYRLVTELDVISRGDEPGKLFDLGSLTVYDAHVSKANRSRIETMPSTVPSLVTGM
jgi:hypothetical protein